MNVTVVSYHAGGAEILSSYIRRNKIKCNLVLDGPAVSIFRNKLGDVNSIALDKAIENSDLCITGTGLASDLEWLAIKKAKDENIKTISFLDHWVNYEERFIRNNEKLHPDEIWVGDKHALTLAKNKFLHSKIKLEQNPYFEDVLERKKEVNKHVNANKILYVCENIKKPNFEQDDAIDYFLNNIEKIVPYIDEIIIRPHPTEQITKYQWILKKYDLPIKISSNDRLLDDLQGSSIVAGCTTMAMVIGLLLDKRVISCIPNNEIPLTLPYKEIESLENLIAKKYQEIS